MLESEPADVKTPATSDGLPQLPNRLAESLGEPLAPAPLPPTAPDLVSAEGLAVVNFLELSHGQREVVVGHEGQWYRLRLTRNNRLILQK